MAEARHAEPSAEVVDQAIAWMVRLHSGTATTDDHARYRQWQQAAPAHATACARLEGIGARVQELPLPLAHAALANGERPAPRRAILRAVLVAVGTGGLAWQGHRSATWQWLSADHSTAVGERRDCSRCAF